MNKKTIITFLLVLTTITGQAQANTFSVHGDLTTVAQTLSKQGVSFDSVTIINPATSEVVAKQPIQNGEFTINGTFENTFYADLIIWNSSEVNGERKLKSSKMPIIIESGDIEFDGNNRIAIIRGTTLNEVLYEAISKHEALDYGKILEKAIIQHKDDAVSIPLLLLLDDTLPEPKTLLTLISQLNDTIQQHPHIAKVKEKAEKRLKRTTPHHLTFSAETSLYKRNFKG